jgi:hypothetical protein
MNKEFEQDKMKLILSVKKLIYLLEKQKKEFGESINDDLLNHLKKGMNIFKGLKLKNE